MLRAPTSLRAPSSQEPLQHPLERGHLEQGKAIVALVPWGGDAHGVAGAPWSSLGDTRVTWMDVMLGGPRPKPVAGCVSGHAPPKCCSYRNLPGEFSLRNCRKRSPTGWLSLLLSPRS